MSDAVSLLELTSQLQAERSRLLGEETRARHERLRVEAMLEALEPLMPRWVEGPIREVWDLLPLQNSVALGQAMGWSTRRARGWIKAKGLVARTSHTPACNVQPASAVGIHIEEGRDVGLKDGITSQSIPLSSRMIIARASGHCDKPVAPGKTGRRYGDEEVLQAWDLARNKDAAGLAEQLGCGLQTAGRKMVKLGLEALPARPATAVMTRAVPARVADIDLPIGEAVDSERIEQLGAEGMNPDQIAKEMGMKVTKVQQAQKAIRASKQATQKGGGGRFSLSGTRID